MLDYLKEICEELGEPQLHGIEDLDAKRQDIVNEYKSKKDKIQRLSDIFNDKDFQMQAKQMRNSAQLLEYLTRMHGISDNVVDDVYAYAKFNYDIGNYDECFEWFFEHY